MPMVERICPECRYGNTVDSHYCSKCGAQLERLLPARPEQRALTIAGKQLPVTWRQLSTTVAVGAAAMAAEVALAWLQRRAAGGQAAPLAKATPAPGEVSPAAKAITTIVSQRVIEIIEGGDGKRTITDRHIWRRFEE
jgi:hypothetical protein